MLPQIWSEENATKFLGAAEGKDHLLSLTVSKLKLVD